MCDCIEIMQAKPIIIMMELLPIPAAETPTAHREINGGERQKKNSEVKTTK